MVRVRDTIKKTLINSKLILIKKQIKKTDTFLKNGSILYLFSRNWHWSRFNFYCRFFKKKEIEDVAFDKENEYAVTSLTINSILPAEKILKIKNVKEEKKIREEIQELIKKYKEPDLTLVISHPEMLTVKIPFVKKNETDLPKLKLTYFNTNAEKNEDFLKYDYIGHLENFGFEWAMNEKNFDFKYEIKIDSSDNTKLIKKIIYQNMQEIYSKMMNQGFGICYLLG